MSVNISNKPTPPRPIVACFFFFNDPATTEIYTLSLHDALPICHFRAAPHPPGHLQQQLPAPVLGFTSKRGKLLLRSEEHTSELQSPCNLVCRLLLEKKITLRPAAFFFRVRQLIEAAIC